MNVKELKALIGKIAEETEESVERCKNSAAQYPSYNANSFKVGYYEQRFKYLLEQLKNISK